MNITDKRISELLRQIGISPAYVGFSYIVYGILLMNDNGPMKYQGNFCRNFYGEVGQHFGNRSTRNIERGIATAIEMAKVNEFVSRAIFKNTLEEYEKPTNKEFIFGVYEYLRLDSSEG